MTASAQPSANLQGVALMTAAVACFAALDTMTQLVTGSVPVVMALWVRYAVQLGLTRAVLLPARGRAVLRTTRPWLQVARALLILSSSLSMYFSMRYLSVGEATAVTMLTPIVIALVAATTLGEMVSPLRWAFLLLGFAGALVVIHPGADFEPAMLLPLGVVLSNAGYQLVTSVLTRADGTGTTHFLTGLFATALLTVALPFGWSPHLDGSHWLLLVGMGLAGSAGHLLLTLSYARAPVAMLTPYLYLQIAFALLGGWLVFGYLPDAWATVGVIAIAASGVGGTAAMAFERRASTRRATRRQTITSA